MAAPPQILTGKYDFSEVSILIFISYEPFEEADPIRMAGLGSPSASVFVPAELTSSDRNTSILQAPPSISTPGPITTPNTSIMFSPFTLLPFPALFAIHSPRFPQFVIQMLPRDVP